MTSSRAGDSSRESKRVSAANSRLESCHRSWSWTLQEGDRTDAFLGDGEVVSTGATEVSVGARIAPLFGAFRPMTGLGASMMRVHRSEDIGEEVVMHTDSSHAFYWELGVEFVGRRGWTVGLHFRELFDPEFTLGGGGGDADYTRVTLALGILL